MTEETHKGHPTSGKAPATGSNARGLVDAILAAAQQRGHSHTRTAGFLGITEVHWYRLREQPARISRAERQLLQRIAQYTHWPLLNVYVATGILPWAEVLAALQPPDAASAALAQLARSPLAAALRTPLSQAASDHRMLIALLYLGAQQASVWQAMTGA